MKNEWQLGGKVPTIGILADWLGDPYLLSVLRGIILAASNCGANLICFASGRLAVERGRSRLENAAFDLASSQSLDAVVVLGSTLSNAIGVDALATYCARFPDLPLLSFGLDLAPHPSVETDNAEGMRALVEHLIRSHAARRIAFVRGPSTNPEASQRLHAYQSVLRDAGIELDENWVVDGDFLPQSGSAAVAELERRGVELLSLDAIVASNDAMAMGVLEALEARRIEVPRRLRVVGFDDVEDARLTRPPLTTVRQPTERMGQRVVQLALDWLRHGERPPKDVLPTELVLRQSCGCGSDSRRPAPSSAPTLDYGFDAALLLRRQGIFEGLTRLAQGGLGAAGPKWQEKLVTTFVDDLRDQDSSTFTRYVQYLLDALSRRGADLNICHELLSELRAQIVPLVPPNDATRRARAEDLLHHARLVAGDAAQQVLKREHLNLSRWMRTLNSLVNTISSCANATELRQAVCGGLPSLSIQRCFVALHDRSGASGTARLLFGYDQTLVTEWSTSKPFAPAMLLPREVIEASPARWSNVVLPLAWRGNAYGHAVFELDERHAYAYSPLADALGVAIHSIDLAGELPEK